MEGWLPEEAPWRRRPGLSLWRGWALSAMLELLLRTSRKPSPKYYSPPYSLVAFDVFVGMCNRRHTLT